MNLRSASETVVYIVFMVLFSLIAAVVTLFLGTSHNLQTPGSLVTELLNLPGLWAGEKILVTVGVDSIAYFLLISGLVALFKRRSRKSRDANSFQKRDL
jgi:hypothetical protein